MSKLIKIDTEYANWIQELKIRYRNSQIKAAAKVNCELIKFYWHLGRDIVARDAENKYGVGFYKNLSQDLHTAIPDSDGFSRQNLQYMKKMYLLYPQLDTNCPQAVGNSENGICPQVVGDLIFSVPWGHHRLIIDKFFEKRRERDRVILHQASCRRRVVKKCIENIYRLQSSFATRQGFDKFCTFITIG